MLLVVGVVLLQLLLLVELLLLLLLRLERAIHGIAHEPAVGKRRGRHRRWRKRGFPVQVGHCCHVGIRRVVIHDDHPLLALPHLWV